MHTDRDASKAAMEILTTPDLDLKFWERDRLWGIATKRTPLTARDRSIIEDIRTRVMGVAA